MELKEYVGIIRKKMWLIIAIVVVACTLSAVKSMFYTEPIYQANAKLIVNQAYEFEGRALLDYSTIQTNIMVIHSYIDIIKSSTVMEKVITNYPDLGKTANELASDINISTTNGSQVMTLSYKDPSYEVAATTVNAVAKVFKEQIPGIMKVDNVTILSSAKLDEEVFSVNINPVISMVISFIMGLMLAMGLVILLDYMDDTFKNEAEILKELGLPTLALITMIKKNDIRVHKKARSQSQTKVGEGEYAATLHS
ncbi:YveK family protein [Paenibacillus sp. FA6]|uniref:YveK family protein n=1 Tax=Paenibacillus sp. FA6 TaxID=3413029 RepID=UPI003F65F304